MYKRVASRRDVESRRRAAYNSSGSAIDNQYERAISRCSEYNSAKEEERGREGGSTAAAAAVGY